MESGILAAIRTDRRGQEAVIGLRGAGATLGEESLLGHGFADPDIRFEALVPSQVRWMPWPSPGDDTQTGFNSIEWAATSVIAARIRVQLDRTHRNRLQSIDQKVAEALVLLSAETVHGSDEPVLHHITRQTLARIIGLNRSVVSTICASFIRRGWCLLDGRAIVVLDADALRTHAAGRLSTATDSLHKRLQLSQQRLVTLVAEVRLHRGAAAPSPTSSDRVAS
ncbi:Crp/Fnr family transcriptional regulator [Nocardioides sp. NPDC101246]|uniref:Crp/Fnr family transcriptional regulator n=1 Tax=Nocardioides sp. NPDC101246 TaxID=3364336 RepID=UPI00381D07D6